MTSPNNIYTTLFTCGDVNGIGPEIVLKTLNKNLHNNSRRIIYICPKNVFIDSISLIKPNFSYRIVKKLPDTWDTEEIVILDLGYCKQSPGKTTKSSGLVSYNAINLSCKLLANRRADAVITSPISKAAFKKAGIDFPGHTELYAQYFKSKDFAMMFLSKKFHAALSTIHIPLNSVKRELTEKKLTSIITVVKDSLSNDFSIKDPKIAVLGLNPHAGESGNIGFEEKKLLTPLIKKYRNNIFGPFVPDAFFGNRLFKKYDCTIGMYHDQILIPFKLLNFNKGVNYTAGLPIVRTSPDHGTAFDIAGKGIANPGSMIEAFKFAQLILKNRRS